MLTQIDQSLCLMIFCSFNGLMYWGIVVFLAQTVDRN